MVKREGDRPKLPRVRWYMNGCEVKGILKKRHFKNKYRKRSKTKPDTMNQRLLITTENLRLRNR